MGKSLEYNLYLVFMSEKISKTKSRQDVGIVCLVMKKSTTGPQCTQTRG